MVLKIFGGIALVFAAFICFLHGALIVQGKSDAETLGRYHEWPVIGGFFPRYVKPPAGPTADDLRAERVELQLAQGRTDFKLPPPFNAEELQRLVDELAAARAETEATGRVQTEAAERLRRAEIDLAERQAAVTGVLDQAAKDRIELTARADELEREKLFLHQSELKSLKTIAAVYESMPPADAAERLKSLDVGAAAKIIAVMSERKAGKILGTMEPTRAVELTKRLQAKVDAGAPRK